MMPAEITLTENMRVRCRGRVTRVLPAQSKFGVAVHLEGYEYLSETESAGSSFGQLPPGFRRARCESAPEKSLRPGSPTLAVEG